MAGGSSRRRLSAVLMASALVLRAGAAPAQSCIPSLLGAMSLAKFPVRPVQADPASAVPVTVLAPTPAARQPGTAQELYMQGLEDSSRLDYTDAAGLFDQASDQGNSGAEIMLAEAYSRGLGVPEDYARAVLWYRRFVAAEPEYAIDVYFVIARLYASGGPNLPRDMSQARYWMRLAAQAGNIRAARWLEAP